MQCSKYRTPKEHVYIYVYLQKKSKPSKCETKSKHIIYAEKIDIHVLTKNKVHCKTHVTCMYYRSRSEIY